MAYCYHCGEEIEFINNGSGPIPIHPSGSCGGRLGGYGGRGESTFRSTSDGAVFEFPFITYPSYINPNARCPVCGASVYFYQSPYGGRVFFDEPGPPWPKLPCTDNPVVRNHFSTADGRARILAAIKSDSESALEETTPPDQGSTVGLRRPIPAWVHDGWMPFVVTQIVPRLIGIEAEGKLFIANGKDSISFRISQTSHEARLYQTRGHLRIGCSLVQNRNPILLAFNQCPILLKCDPDLQQLVLSTFVLDHSGGVEEMTIPVVGTRLSETA